MLTPKTRRAGPLGLRAFPRMTKALRRRDYVEDLEMGRRARVTQVGPKCDLKCPVRGRQKQQVPWPKQDARLLAGRRRTGREPRAARSAAQEAEKAGKGLCPGAPGGASPAHAFSRAQWCGAGASGLQNGEGISARRLSCQVRGPPHGSHRDGRSPRLAAAPRAPLLPFSAPDTLPMFLVRLVYRVSL